MFVRERQKTSHPMSSEKYYALNFFTAADKLKFGNVKRRRERLDGQNDSLDQLHVTLVYQKLEVT